MEAETFLGQVSCRTNSYYCYNFI